MRWHRISLANLDKHVSSHFYSHNWPAGCMIFIIWEHRYLCVLVCVRVGECVCVGGIYYSTDPAGSAKQSDASKPNKHTPYVCVCGNGWLNIHARSGAHTHSRSVGVD